MYLKKIIISGFKSFADKIVISLDKGITGIVGPNGSGKSNVIDAVRWVMGEQNAKNLRGEKATDIIFAGSERRKSLGMAEVSLVFDNTDDSVFCPPEYRHETEISLTRRLYADGQREYLINRKPCRLKDIIGFFATTGLGGRSYSMIQQGQVDRILNAKPEDVREILEEAAGTMVFKKRKAEAEKKLGETHLNLSRIEDILLEVEKQLSSLEDQVEKAKEYQGLADRLKEEEVSLFAHNFRHFKDEQTKLKDGLDTAVTKEAETLAEMSALEARHAELQGQLDDSDPEIQVLQESIALVREKIARAESTLKSALDRIENGGRRLRDISQELAEDDANLKVLEGQVDGSRRELDGAEVVARHLNEAIESFEHEVEVATEAAQVYQGRMDEFEDEIRNLERLLESNKFRTEQLEKDFARNQGEQSEEQTRLTLVKSEIEGVTADLAEAERRAGATKAGLDQEIREKHEREASVAQAYQQMKDANQRRDKQRERYHEVRGRFTSLQELDAGATDVAGAINKLKTEDADAANLVRGLLADWISFSPAAAELPKMASAAFERWAERVVVENLTSFNELVRVAHRLGVGTLPVALLSRMESVDAAAVATWAERHGAEPLKTYLTVEAGLPSIDTLISRLYLLPTLSLDDEAMAEVPRGAIVFTSQGVMFAGDDELVIGSRASGGLLSRKTELEVLAKELKTLEGDLSRAQAEIDELELKINSDRQIIADVDAKYRAQSQEVLEVMTAYQTVKQVYDRKNELIQSAEIALAKHQTTDARLVEERESLTKNRFSLQRELTNARSELKTIEEDAESLVERREEIRRLHDGKRLDLAKSEARAQALRDSFLQSKAQLELLQNKLSRRYDERSRLEQDSEIAKREEAQATVDIEACVKERDVLQNDYASRREENSGVVEELRVIDNRLRALREIHGSLQRGLAEKNVHLERVRMALAGVTEQAVEKYKLDLDTFTTSGEFVVDPEFNHDGRQRSVSRLRNKIEGMGAINMMALVEFEEKGGRRDFIVKQRDEVLSAIDLLTAAIGEIEETSLKKFLEIFERINVEFGQLFPILFPTGEGKLEMTSPDKPLEGGVEILCRLPGKSQKPMSLFSGGEKALTAMALIFALLKTKPTPYCFLDEVDAPLDEANVGRYNRVLEALAHQFQFIVITHNRRTMEVLDTLYGITMQEPGVSKVVGVDMQKDLPPHLRKAFKDEKAENRAVPPPGATAADRNLMGATVN